MSTNRDDKSRAYVTQARDEQQRYVSDLLRENEKLRSALVAMESDCRSALELHRTAMNELETLRAQFEGVARENERYLEQYQAIETQSGNLANLYVASYQLHSSVDRELVLQTILEIVINLVGSEEVAIFERHGDGKFHIATSFGVDADRLSSFIAGQGPIGRHLQDGSVFTGAGDVSACVPLKVGDDIVGAILVFRLLDHKSSLQPVDYELFDLLAVHAATALYCASLHAKKAAVCA